MGKEKVEVNNEQQSKRGPLMLMLAASIYAVWLTWLAYVAWVNVNAGNQ